MFGYFCGLIVKLQFECIVCLLIEKGVLKLVVENNIIFWFVVVIVIFFLEVGFCKYNCGCFKLELIKEKILFNLVGQCWRIVLIGVSLLKCMDSLEVGKICLVGSLLLFNFNIF